MEVLWDPPKRLANIDKHGLEFEDVTPAFFAAAVIRPARLGRLQAVGYLNGPAVGVIFAVMGREAVSLISLRPANPAERRLLRVQ